MGDGAGRQPFELLASAARAAVDQASLAWSDLDGVCAAFLLQSGHKAAAYFPSVAVAEYLGIQGSHYFDSTNLGGASFVSHVGKAAQAVDSGRNNAILICFGSSQRSDRSRVRLGAAGVKEPARAYEVGADLPLPVGAYALAAARHKHLFGTSAEQLAQITVSASQWAALNNEGAARRKALTVEDVITSPMLCDPLHILDCCLISDGAAAVIVAPNSAGLGPLILGFAEAAHHNSIANMPDLAETAAVETGPAALRMADLTTSDIDVFQIYDSFTYTVLACLEDLGLCAKGEGGAFVQEFIRGPQGPVKLNSSGGGLAYAHPGMFGPFLITEAVTQLNGTAGRRQVLDAETALIHGVGGALAAHATLIMANG